MSSSVIRLVQCPSFVAGSVPLSFPFSLGSGSCGLSPTSLPEHPFIGQGRTHRRREYTECEVRALAPMLAARVTSPRDWTVSKDRACGRILTILSRLQVWAQHVPSLGMFHHRNLGNKSGDKTPVKSCCHWFALRCASYAPQRKPRDMILRRPCL